MYNGSGFYNEGKQFVYILIIVAAAAALLWLARDFRANLGRKTLRSKINWLVLLVVFIVLFLVLSAFSFIVIKTRFNELGQRALSTAKVVAEMPEIIKALDDSDPSAVIQPITEKIRRQTGASYINVASMSLITYSDLKPQNIGRMLVGDDYIRVLLGEYSISQDESTLGLKVRAKAPVIGADNGQRGIVVVGFNVGNIWRETYYYLIVIALVGILGLGAGFIGAYLLSGHVKKQILNMEPSEIAFLAEEQAAILDSIREGIVAVDINGKITACNHEAKRLLEIEPSENILGRHVTDVIRHSRLPELLSTGTVHLDQPMILGNTLVIVNRVPVRHAGKVIGAVSSFRDKMQLEQIDRRLADVGRYVDDLRSQRHEAMNRLHTIAGLIKIREYDLAAKLIDQVSDEQQRVLEFFLARIRDSAVVGILLGKMHRANEIGVRLVVDPKSHLLNNCMHRELVVTILGNAIENSFEAFLNWEHKTREGVVTVYINDETEQLTIRIKDTGPGVDPEIKDRIFEDGVSTKGAGRGFGLALIRSRMANIGGTLEIESSAEGTVFKAVLPKQIIK